MQMSVRMKIRLELLCEQSGKKKISACKISGSVVGVLV